MFDVGFLELFVVMVIALMVIGPERMPEVARKIGQFLGKTKRFINSMKEDSEFSSAINEMKESINLQEEKQHIEEMRGTLANEVEENFSRPSFGGSSENNSTSSQFNKAPTQPQISKTDTTEQTKQAEPSAVELTDTVEKPTVETQDETKKHEQ